MIMLLAADLANANDAPLILVVMVGVWVLHSLFRSRPGLAVVAVVVVCACLYAVYGAPGTPAEQQQQRQHTSTTVPR